MLEMQFGIRGCIVKSDLDYGFYVFCPPTATDSSPLIPQIGPA